MRPIMLQGDWTMSEEQIERIAEQRMDALDRRLLAGELTQVDYDLEVKRLDQWARIVGNTSDGAWSWPNSQA